MRDDRDAERSGAPAGLEDVRTLLNSWRVPNDSRLSRDDLAEWLADEQYWLGRFASIPYPRRGSQTKQLRRTRDAVRELVNGDPGRFDELVAEQPPTITVDERRLVFTPMATPSSCVVALILDAAARGTLPRLRTCLDCGWSFYDSSRNNRRRWCAMNPSERGRGCGAAAKSRTYRERAHR